MAPIVATVVETWPEGTKMEGVVLPSTTPTGGTNFEIVLTKRERRERVGEGQGQGLTGICLRVDIHVYACASIIVCLSYQSVNQVHGCVLVV